MGSRRARPSGRRRTVAVVSVLVPASLALALVAVPDEPRRDAFEPGDAVPVAAAVGQMAGDVQPEPVEAVPAPYVRDGAR